MLGGFYMKEDSHLIQRLMAANRTTGEILALELKRDQPIKDTEYAAFANVTYHFTDRFDVQFGGRESQNREEDGTYIQTGPFVPGGIAIQEPLHSKANTFTYLVTPRFRISPELMVYARFASGYRPGGPNFAINYGAPGAYKPDTTDNYEVGFKGDLFDGTLSLDASLYYIDWKDIQLSLRTPPPENYTYLDNASRAKSQGVGAVGQCEASARDEPQRLGCLQRCEAHGGVPVRSNFRGRRLTIAEYTAHVRSLVVAAGVPAVEPCDGIRGGCGNIRRRAHQPLHGERDPPGVPVVHQDGLPRRHEPRHVVGECVRQQRRRTSGASSAAASRTSLLTHSFTSSRALLASACRRAF